MKDKINKIFHTLRFSFFNYIWQILLGLVVTSSVYTVTIIAVTVFIKLLESFINPIEFFAMSIAGPHSIYSWVIILFSVVIGMLPSFLLAKWVYKDYKKSAINYVKTSLYIWSIGVFLPTSIVVFPLYLIKRNIIWVKNINNNFDKDIIQPNKHKTKKIIWVIVSLFIIYNVSFDIVVSNRNKSIFKPIISYIVKNNLSDDCNSSPGCHEQRPLPKTLQNKKIVFEKNTPIMFDRYEDSSVDLSELDTLGYIDSESNVDADEIKYIDPKLEKRGFLEEREYKIVRAVYSYKCFLCIDSSSVAYVVLEDSKGNRFITFLDDNNFSTPPGIDLTWDEYLPYFLEKDREGKDSSYAKLEDI